MAAPLSATQAQTAVVHTEIAGEPAHQSGVFPPFDSTHFVSQIIWLAIVFGLLYWLMSRIALPRVAGILEARHLKLSRDLDDASAMQEQAKAAGEAHDKTLAAARAGVQSLAQQTHDKLHAESETRRHALEADLNAKLAAAEAQIADTKAKAMTNVATIARDAAGALVEHLTGRKPDDATVGAAVAATETR